MKPASTSSARASLFRGGVFSGVLAYTIWGLFPLYFTLIDRVPALEVTANRIVWCLILVVIVISVTRRWSHLRALLRKPRSVALLTLAGCLLAANWTIYIYAVNRDQVVEGALGYYINPLMTVLFGVVLLRERLSRAQWWAIGLGALAVVVLTIEVGRPPWIALGVAFTFGSYGLAKKFVQAPPLEGLGVETGVLLLPAAALLLVQVGRDESAFQLDPWWIGALLIGTGLITAVPLLLFARATKLVPLSTMGLMQYITPTLQFIIGVVVLSEPFPPARFIGFALVWAALAILAVDGWRNARREIDPADADELALP